MNVAALQFDIAWENKKENFARVRRFLLAERPTPGTLVALPEMFATGFSMNTGAITETAGGETERFLAETAAEFGVWLVAGAPVRGRDGKARNKALVFSPSGTLDSFYAKMRPFTPGGEAGHYTAGQRPVAFDWNGCAVSPFICYDLRFPELFRKAIEAFHTELFVVIASFPVKRIHHWTRLLQARAIENQAFVIGVNRAGTDPHFVYNGRSMVVDYDGEIIADAGEREGWISAVLDLDALRKYREGLPFLKDARPV